MAAEEAIVEVDVKEVAQQIVSPKYILTLGVPVTHRWKDKDGVKQSRTYPAGTELGVIYPFIGRVRNQRWADCITPDGIMLMIGHNRKHQLREIGVEEAEAIDIATAMVENPDVPFVTVVDAVQELPIDTLAE